MKIFTITMAPISPPYNDGAKNIVMGIAQRIKKHLFYFVSSLGNKFAPETNIAFIPSLFQKPGRHSMSILQKLYVLFITVLIAKKIDVFQFFITPQPYFSGFYSRFVKKNGKKSVQILTSIHTLFNKNANVPISSLFFADRVVVHSDYAKEKLTALGVKNVIRVYPGVETQRFGAPRGSDLKHAPLPRVIYPGTYKILNDSYSFSELLKIALLVTKKIRNAEFVMACRVRTKEDAKLKKEFAVLLKNNGVENFTLLDTVEDMPALFNSCAAGIMPVRRPMVGILEIPLVLLELAVLGKPVIYGNIAPLDELERHGIGIKISGDGADAYAENLIRCLKDAKFYSDVANKSQDGVKRCFTMDAMAAEYDKIYSEIGG
ncbi:MAG: glycosyltransferase family 4 protein [Candidatus Omnitrophota bacterium]|nr:glycosyltransferase family 4 protein [Candidatus Omnitrophota bacterium]